MPVITPQTLGMMHFCTDTAQKADYACVHKHAFTFHSGKHVMICCRVCTPAGFKKNTGPVLVTPSDSAEIPFGTSRIIHEEDRSKRQDRHRLTHPIPEVDKRCIVWEIKRRELNFDAESAWLDPEIKAARDVFPQNQKEILIKALQVRNG